MQNYVAQNAGYMVNHSYIVHTERVSKCDFKYYSVIIIEIEIERIPQYKVLKILCLNIKYYIRGWSEKFSA